MKKICLVSSSGGHLAQLQQLIPLVRGYNYFVVTELNESTKDLCTKHKTYFLMQQERRDISFLFKLFINLIKSLFIIIKERPKVILSTGAGVVLPICILGKLLRSQVVFIESFAKITSPTLTGRIIYKFADEFYVQWEEMLKHYPNAKYKGTIY